MKKFLLSAAAALLLAGCASNNKSLSPSDFGPAYGSDFGYRNTQLQSDRFRVSYTSRDPYQSYDFALLRAAQIATNEGYSHFQIIGGDGYDNGPNPISTGVAIGFGGRGYRGSNIGIGVRDIERTLEGQLIEEFHLQTDRPRMGAVPHHRDSGLAVWVKQDQRAVALNTAAMTDNLIPVIIIHAPAEAVMGTFEVAEPAVEKALLPRRLNNRGLHGGEALGGDLACLWELSGHPFSEITHRAVHACGGGHTVIGRLHGRDTLAEPAMRPRPALAAGQALEPGRSRDGASFSAESERLKPPSSMSDSSVLAATPLETLAQRKTVSAVTIWPLSRISSP